MLITLAEELGTAAVSMCVLGPPAELCQWHVKFLWPTTTGPTQCDRLSRTCTLAAPCARLRGGGISNRIIGLLAEEPANQHRVSRRREGAWGVSALLVKSAPSLPHKNLGSFASAVLL